MLDCWQFHSKLGRWRLKIITEKRKLWFDFWKTGETKFLAKKSKLGTENTGNREISPSCISLKWQILKIVRQFWENWFPRFFGTWRSLIERVTNWEHTVLQVTADYMDNSRNSLIVALAHSKTWVLWTYRLTTVLYSKQEHIRTAARRYIVQLPRFSPPLDAIQYIPGASRV